MKLSKLNRSSTIRSVLCLIILTAFAVSEASSQATSGKPELKLTSPTNGLNLYGGPAPTFPVTIGYDTVTQTLQISGDLKNIPREWIVGGTHNVYVNDYITPATITLSPTITIIEGVETSNGTFGIRVPIEFFELWPMRGIIAELVEDATQITEARDEVTIFDFRLSPNATTDGDPADKLFGFRTQLTDNGIGYTPPTDTEAGLEPANRTSLPQPDLSTFNAKLTSIADDISYDDNANLLGACIDLTALSAPEFRDPDQFPAYRNALRTANLQHEAFTHPERCLLLGNPAAITACYASLQVLCAKADEPEAADFELCIDQIEGQSRTLTIGGIEEIGMNFISSTTGANATLESNVVLANMRGTVDGFLRSLSVRWKAAGCLPRPRSKVQDSYIRSTPWLNNWATCRNMEVMSGQASSYTNDKPGEFTIIKDNTSREKLKGKLKKKGDLTLFGNTVDGARGACADPSLEPDAETMLRTFHEPFRIDLKNTWFGTSSSSQHADSLTKLMSPYSVGIIAHNDMTVSAEFDKIYSSPIKGMVTSWVTKLNATNPVAIQNKKPSYLFLPPAGPLDFVSDTGEDHLVTKFDTSFGVAVPYLNRVLNIKAADGSLMFKYEPTWAELVPFGVTTPVGADPEGVATLDQTTLAQFNPAFNQLDPQNVEINLRPVFDPFVFMPPDVRPSFIIPDVGVPTVYGIGSLEVILKYVDTNGPTGKVIGKQLAKLHVGFTDRQFRFSIDGAPGAQFLLPFMNSDIWTARVVTSDLKSCEMYKVNNLPGNCEDVLEEEISQLIENRLRPTFADYLTRIPAPQYFDAAGDATIPVNFDERSRLQDGQIITFFGKFIEQQP